MTTIPVRQIRATYDADTITVYQAYSPQIAVAAAANGRFADGFKRERMTWIKPSFLWMMYRSGWATKPGQEHILAIRIRRDGFAWALANSALSSYEHGIHADRAAWKRSMRAPVRIQWDPERDLHLRPLPHRAIQIGLSGEAVHRYADEWITGITTLRNCAKRSTHGWSLGISLPLLPCCRPNCRTPALRDEPNPPHATEVVQPVSPRGVSPLPTPVSGR